MQTEGKVIMSPEILSVMLNMAADLFKMMPISPPHRLLVYSILSLWYEFFCYLQFLIKLGYIKRVLAIPLIMCFITWSIRKLSQGQYIHTIIDNYIGSIFPTQFNEVMWESHHAKKSHDEMTQANPIKTRLHRRQINFKCTLSFT